MDSIEIVSVAGVARGVAGDITMIGFKPIGGMAGDIVLVGIASAPRGENVIGEIVLVGEIVAMGHTVVVVEVGVRIVVVGVVVVTALVDVTGDVVTAVVVVVVVVVVAGAVVKGSVVPFLAWSDSLGLLRGALFSGLGHGSLVEQHAPITHT